MTLTLLLACQGRSELAASKHAGALSAVDATPQDRPATLHLNVPMVFHAESTPLQTTACLGVDELLPAAKFGGIEPAFNALMQSFKNKDALAYQAITLAEQRGPRAPCGEQSGAFFSQFETLSPAGIRMVYAFDDLAVVQAKIKQDAKDLLLPFVFLRAADGAVSFLPCRSQKLSYVLVSDWLKYASSGGAEPARCATDVVERATHRVQIDPDVPAQGALQLLLRGAPITTKGDLKDLAGRISVACNGLQKALAAKNVQDAVRYMTADGGEQLRTWWQTASPVDRDIYVRAVGGQKPFFVFDASPLIVAYTHGESGIQVMYFVPAPSNRVLWVNASYMTMADNLFKRGQMRAAAQSPDPFSSLRINKSP